MYTPTQRKNVLIKTCFCYSWSGILIYEDNKVMRLNFTDNTCRWLGLYWSSQKFYEPPTGGARGSEGFYTTCVFAPLYSTIVE